MSNNVDVQRADAMVTHSRLESAESNEPDQSSAPTRVGVGVVPPLENGDRLTRAEFERRYEGMPYLKKAELIEGVVYVSSPVRYPQHSLPESDAQMWLGTYRVGTPGTRNVSNTTVRIDIDNEVQPDLLLRIELGGQTRVSEDGYVEGAPELVIEIAASSASYDLHDKLRAYRRNAVQEYIVWRTLDRAVDWFALEDTTYRRFEPDEDGVVRSRVFPGLWLAVSALLDGDMATVLATVQEGLASAEHAAFVERLQSRTREQSRQPDA